MKRSFRLRAATGAIAATAMFLTACGSNTDGSSEDGSGSDGKDSAETFAGFIGERSDAGDPVDGGTLTVADYSEPTMLDPARTYAFGSTGGNVMINVYDALMKLDPETGKVSPQLAKSLEANDDNTTWTLTLRDGVKFTDGSPLDAKAVVPSIQRYIDNYGQDAYLLALYLESMKATSPNTVTFEMNRPWAHFPLLLAGGMGMIAAPAAYADPEAFEPIGAGPFKLLRHAPAEELVLEANPDYWGEAPHLDQVRFIWPAGGAAKMDVLDQGQAHIAYIKEPQLVESAIEDGRIGHVEYTSLEYAIDLNHREGYPTADRRIRKAIQLAIDPELVFARTYQGSGFPTKTMFGEHSKWSTGAKAPVDAEQAKELVAEAKADGADTSIEYFSTRTPEGRAQALSVKALLDGIGLDVEIVYANSVTEVVQKVFVDHDFDMTTGGHQMADGEAVIRAAGNFHSGSVTNAAGYASKEMDALLVELQAAATDEEIQGVFDQIGELFLEDVPFVSMGAGQTFYPQSEKLHGVQRSSQLNLMFNEAWLAQ